jgi:hypothetical protein
MYAIAREAIMFKFKDVIVIVEWLCDTFEPHRFDSWEHGSA